MARKRYWLLKCEPEAYSIDDLERDGRASWEGVRNFQARNLLRDELRIGDGVLFYASNAEPSGVTGIAEVVRAGYPDPFATKHGHKYFDPKSDPAAPTWYAVDVGFVEKFPGIVPLATLKATRGLADMMVVQKGSRLSVQPVAAREFEIVRRLGRAGGARSGAGSGDGDAAGAKTGRPERKAGA
ncbi:MAG TPA: EVE domain-containing protein [Thermoanaerobaculia bacterium]|nr:EVE domain-containing protein [Thermoanaerobaculia bacterium]